MSGLELVVANGGDDPDFVRRIDPATVIGLLPKPAYARMKVISLGTEGVGKSCIIKRYCEERFVAKYITTIGIDYGVKRVSIEQQEVRVNFWDLAGGSEYLDIRNEFYKDAQCAILVFDVNSQRSFLQLEQCLQESARFGGKDLVVAVCANKMDAITGRRAVTEQEARRWATSKGFAYWETSAQSGQNVAAMFDQLFRDTYMLRKL